jgi:hypothetical protein
MYDSENDTLDHQQKVRALMGICETEIGARLSEHDASKLCPPEKQMFDAWRPMLDANAVDSPAYKNALVAMGDALQHHHKANRHHPEHFENGIAGMTLIDLVEMVCDWSAASKRKDPNGTVDMRWACDRFKIDGQLSTIIQNTLSFLDKDA